MAAVTVYVTVLPTLTPIVSLIGPLPEAAPQRAPALAEQLHLVMVMPVGGVSETVTPTTLSGPLLLTSMV